MKYNFKELTDRLYKLLRLQTTPIGIKGFENLEEMNKVQKLRKPKHIFTPCQMIGQAIQTGITIGFTSEDVVTYHCNAIIGFEKQDELWLRKQKEMFTNVWWENENDVEAHHHELTKIQKVKFKGIVVSPLSSERIDPDVCLINGSPGSIFMLLSGYVRAGYKPIDFKFIGESSCSVHWVKTLYTGEIGLSTPCFAEMRYAGFSEDSIILTMKPKDLVKALNGLEELGSKGMRFPVPSYSVHTDVREGVGISYDLR